MKKLILASVCLLSCLTLVGCGGVSDTDANKTLNNQLSRVENVLSSSVVEGVGTVTPSDFIDNESGSKIIDQKNLSLYNSQTEKMLREQILDTTSQIKSYDQSSIKLGNDKASAIKNLSENISKYLTYLNNSKGELKNSVSKINRNNKITNTNLEELNSNFVELNSNLKEREAYLTNLLEALQEVENIYASSKTSTAENTTSENASASQTEKQAQNGQTNRFAPNIDTYRTNPPIYNGYNNYARGYNNVAGNGYNFGYNSNNYNRAYGYRPYGAGYGMNGYNGYGYGYGAYGGYGYGNEAFNPGRNTDTYAPIERNVDTYRSGYQGTDYVPQILPAKQNENTLNETIENKTMQNENQTNVGKRENMTFQQRVGNLPRRNANRNFRNHYNRENEQNNIVINDGESAVVTLQETEANQSAQGTQENNLNTISSETKDLKQNTKENKKIKQQKKIKDNKLNTAIYKNNKKAEREIEKQSVKQNVATSQKESEQIKSPANEMREVSLVFNFQKPPRTVKKELNAPKIIDKPNGTSEGSKVM